MSKTIEEMFSINDVTSNITYYEKLISTMYTEDVTLAEAIDIDLTRNNIQFDDTLEVCDHIEKQCETMEQFQILMDVYTGAIADMRLVESEK